MKRRDDAIALALLAALITLLFADILFGFRSLYVRDLLHYYYPAKKLLRDIVVGGEFPWWNPFFHGGQPLAANPEHEVFYPPTWLILLPRFDLAFHLLIVLHVYVTAFATYALLRSMRARPAAAFFGAYAFAMSGFLLSCLNLLPILFSVAWMPFTLLYARRFLQTRARRDFALAGAFLGLQLLVGEPTTVAQTALLLGLYACSARPRARRIGAVALIGVAGLLVAMVQVLPTLDHFRDTIRAGGLRFEVVSQWSMEPRRLLELFAPDFANATWGGGNEHFLFSIYPGIFVTVLALLGVATRARGSGLTLAVCAASILLALGHHTALLRILYDLGIGRSTRFPEKFILMALFAMTLFAATTFDALLARRAPLRRPLVLIIAGALLILDLARLLPVLAPRVPSSFYRDTPAAAARFPPNRAEFRIFHYADRTRGSATGRVYNTPRPDRVWLMRNSLAPMLPAAYGLRTVLERDLDVTSLETTNDFTRAAWELKDALPREWLNLVAAMTNTWYVGVYNDPRTAFAARDPRAVEPVRFIEGHHYPRYAFARELVRVADREEFVAALASGRHSAGTAFVDAAPFPPAEGRVLSVREWTNGARVDVEARGRAFLVASVTAHKYWHLAVDGEEAPAVLTNLAFQGVAVPPGRHVIEWRYRNPLIPAGGAVSAAALLALLLIGRDKIRRP